MTSMLRRCDTCQKRRQCRYLMWPAFGKEAYMWFCKDCADTNRIAWDGEASHSQSPEPEPTPRPQDTHEHAWEDGSEGFEECSVCGRIRRKEGVITQKEVMSRLASSLTWALRVIADSNQSPVRMWVGDSEFHCELCDAKPTVKPSDLEHEESCEWHKAVSALKLANPITEPQP